MVKWERTINFRRIHDQTTVVDLIPVRPEPDAAYWSVQVETDEAGEPLPGKLSQDEQKAWNNEREATIARKTARAIDEAPTMPNVAEAMAEPIRTKLEKRFDTKVEITYSDGSRIVFKAVNVVVRQTREMTTRYDYVGSKKPTLKPGREAALTITAPDSTLIEPECPSLTRKEETK